MKWSPRTRSEKSIVLSMVDGWRMRMRMSRTGIRTLNTQIREALKKVFKNLI